MVRVQEINILPLLRVASAFVSYLEVGSTPGRHYAAEDGRVEASTTLELDCTHLQRNESHGHNDNKCRRSTCQSMQVEIRNYILC